MWWLGKCILRLLPWKRLIIAIARYFSLIHSQLWWDLFCLWSWSKKTFGERWDTSSKMNNWFHKNLNVGDVGSKWNICYVWKQTSVQYLVWNWTDGMPLWKKYLGLVRPAPPRRMFCYTSFSKETNDSAVTCHTESFIYVKRKVFGTFKHAGDRLF